MVDTTEYLQCLSFSKYGNALQIIMKVEILLFTVNFQKNIETNAINKVLAVDCFFKNS